MPIQTFYTDLTRMRCFQISYICFRHGCVNAHAYYTVCAELNARVHLTEGQCSLYGTVSHRPLTTTTTTTKKSRYARNGRKTQLVKSEIALLLDHLSKIRVIGSELPIIILSDNNNDSPADTTDEAA